MKTILLGNTNIKIFTVSAGCMRINPLDDVCKGAKIALSKKEWYKIYISAGNILP